MGSRFSRDGKEDGGYKKGGYKSGGYKSGGGSGGYKKGGYKKGGRGNDDEFPFTRVGSIAPTKGTDEDTIEELQNSDINLWLNVYLPKGVKSLEIDNSTKILIKLKRPKNSPDFVIGSALLPKDE